MDLAILIPIVGIVMGISIPLTAIRLKHREKIEQMRLAASGTGDSAQIARQDARIEELEDRMAVLERIITDNSVNVAAQIEALRDTASIEELTRERSQV